MNNRLQQQKKQKLRHSETFSENNHNHLWKTDVKILSSNYRNKVKRNISEARYIRTMKSA